MIKSAAVLIIFFLFINCDNKESLEKHEDAAQWFAQYQADIADAERVDRNSVTQQFATPRGRSQLRANYDLDPFVGGPPGAYYGG